MVQIERRFDIDWLRVIAIGLLIIYHIAIGFQPWGVLIGFIQSDQTIDTLWIPMSMLNVWRIPLLFFISGMGVCFALSKRNFKQLLAERAKRILNPFLFGVFVIVPIHIYLWQGYYNQDLVYSPNPSHLWFLGNIFVYVIVLLPLFYYLKNKYNSAVARMFRKVFSHPLSFFIILACFICEAIIVDPDMFELYAMTLHGFVLGFLAFLFGFLLVYAGSKSWENIAKYRWGLLIGAIVLYGVRFFVYDFKVPGFYLAVESNFWIFSVFGLGYKYLRKPGKVLRYLSKGAYTVYIVHMVFTYIGAIIIFPLNIPVIVKFFVLVLFTMSLSIGFYEVVRHISFLRPLFGLKLNKRRRAIYIKDRTVVKSLK